VAIALVVVAASTARCTVEPLDTTGMGVYIDARAQGRQTDSDGRGAAVSGIFYSHNVPFAWHSELWARCFLSMPGKDDRNAVMCTARGTGLFDMIAGLCDMPRRDIVRAAARVVTPPHRFLRSKSCWGGGCSVWAPDLLVDWCCGLWPRQSGK
jgi:hypothetical protein